MSFFLYALAANREGPPEYELLIIKKDEVMPKLKERLYQGDPVTIWLKEAKDPIKGVLSGIEPDSLLINEKKYALESIGKIRLEGPEANRSRANRSILGFLSIVLGIPIGYISGFALTALLVGDFEAGIIHGVGIGLGLTMLILGIRMLVNSGKYKSGYYSLSLGRREFL